PHTSQNASRYGCVPHTTQSSRDLFARAAPAEHPAGLALAEVAGDPFHPGAEIEGRALAARMRAFLRDRFDEDWWRNPRSVASLNSLWGRGGRSTQAELWAEVGAGPGIGPLVQELSESCR